jgi:hypothetical protein
MPGAALISRAPSGQKLIKEGRNKNIEIGRLFSPYLYNVVAITKYIIFVTQALAHDFL